MSKTLLILALLGLSPIVFVTSSALTTYFDAPLNTNGIDPDVTWAVTGVAAPDVEWWADDPTGAGTATTGTWTATGTPASVDTPFCWDGSHSDLTSNCMTARRFDGTEYYLSDSNPGAMDPASADFSVCTLYRGTGDGFLASQREGSWGGGEGWSIKISTAGPDIYDTVENHAGTSRTFTWDTVTVDNGDWFLTCITADYDGNLVPYANSSADTTTTSPGGTIAPSIKTAIGAANDGNDQFTGDIVFVLFWNSLLDATDMQELFEYFAGINDNEAAPVAATTTGPTCAWVDGKIECFGDDWPIVGAEIPVGATGAGSPASGLLSMASLTNQIPYSRDLSSWTGAGAVTVTCSYDATLFRDGRDACYVGDDNSGGWEYIEQTIDMSSMATSDDYVVCAYAKADDASQTLDFTFTEDVGAGCTTRQPSVAAQNITTSWKLYEFDMAVVDGDCENLTIRMVPHDGADGASGTGHVIVVAQVYFNQDWCPPTYIETEASAVTAGADFVNYDISGVAGIADVADGTIVSVDFTPRAATSTGGYIWEIADSATAVDYYRLTWHTDEKLYVYGQSTEEGSEKAMYTSTSAWSPTAGTTYTLAVTVNGSATTLEIDGASEAGSNVTLTNAPNSLDNLAVCALDAGTSQPGGWCDTVSVEK